MKWNRSDWYIPRDWVFILTWWLIISTVAIVNAMLLPALWKARQGETTLFYVALGLACVGVVLLFFARLPLYRQRKFLTFGPRLLPRGNRRLYWISYGFIGVGVTLMLLLLAILK